MVELMRLGTTDPAPTPLAAEGAAKPFKHRLGLKSQGRLPPQHRNSSIPLSVPPGHFFEPRLNHVGIKPAEPGNLLGSLEV
jgi:hypothetical protein